MLTRLTNDIDFISLVSDMRKSFRAFHSHIGLSMEHDYVRLYAAFYIGRTDILGEQKAIKRLNTPFATNIKQSQYFEDIAVLEFPLLQELSDRHSESISVVTSLVLAYATTPEPDLKHILTTTEAAELWGIDSSTIRKALESGKFEEHEYRKSGPRSWLITYHAMERVYGKI